MEKWIKSKPRRVVKYSYKTSPAYYFKDSDKDGVPNVFDCKPHNKKKQDVMSPLQSSSPLRDMFARQEQDRLQREYLANLKKIQQQTATPPVYNYYTVNRNTYYSPKIPAEWKPEDIYQSKEGSASGVNEQQIRQQGGGTYIGNPVNPYPFNTTPKAPKPTPKQQSILTKTTKITGVGNNPDNIWSVLARLSQKKVFQNIAKYNPFK